MSTSTSTSTNQDFIRSVTDVLGLPYKGSGVVSCAATVVMTALANNLLTCVQNSPTDVLKWHKAWKDDRKWATTSGIAATPTPTPTSLVVRVLLYVLRLIKRVYGVQWCVRWLTDLKGFTKPDTTSSVQLSIPITCGGGMPNRVFDDLMW